MALDVSGAAGRRAVDAGEELAAAARVTSTAAAEVLRRAGGPVARAGVLLTRSRLDGLLDGQSGAVAAAGRRVGREIHRRLDADGDRVSSRRAVLGAYDPDRQLGRGWTLTRTADGRLVRSAAQLTEGDELVTTLADGEATSTVVRVTRDRPDSAP
jgi:exonuclease VII large subunit